ncbi:MAG: thymidine phosphorylase, partial [Oceanipulchritudo sp.]
MTPQSVISRKRDGDPLGEAEIREFVSGVVDGSWSRGQTGSMLMALFQRGLGREETVGLLQAMLHSGDTLDMEGIGRPVVDKHSTGGVGDKVSLVLAPLAAACGLAVPMLSGRGLGHTGGTLDKLESIPGFRVFLTPAEVRAQVERIGCVIAGQTERIVPADRILYAMRDETATVEHPALVATSILSKKLAEGLDALFLDVKFGRGAFFKEYAKAEELARLMVDLGKAAGCRVEAWLTRMDAPLGRAVGNAVEIEECIRMLKGEGSAELAAFICEQVAAMLVLSGDPESFEEALAIARERLSSGEALNRFRAMIEAQGGDVSVIEDPEGLPQARVVEDILHEEAEPVWISDVDARKVAELVLKTGAGRRNADEPVDHA